MSHDEHIMCDAEIARLKRKNKELKEVLIQLSAAVFDNVDYPENGEIEKALIKAQPFITKSE